MRCMESANLLAVKRAPGALDSTRVVGDHRAISVFYKQGRACATGAGDLFFLLVGAAPVSSTPSRL